MLDVKALLIEILSCGDYRKALWSNTSTSNFNAQTVQLDLSAYDAVDVEFSNGSSQTSGGQIFRVSVGGNGLCALNGGTSSTLRGRYFAVDSTGITFNGATTGGGSANNGVCIPRRIWGIKLGGGS